MTLKSLEYLRNNGWRHMDDVSYAMFQTACNDVQAEVDERYLELPCDYNGAPIHIGDVLTTVNGYKRRVDDVFTDGFAAHKKFNYYEKEHAKDYIHAKPDAVKELLGEFDKAARDIHTTSEFDELMEEYAERIRKAVSGE